MNARRQFRSLISGTTALLVAGGLVVCLLTLIFQPLLKAQLHVDWHQVIDIFGLLFQSLGLSAITSGFFSVLFSTQPWREYFQSGLADIIYRQDYLNRLSDIELRQMHAGIVRKIYNSNDVDVEGGFFHQCLTGLMALMGKPFREDARCSTHLKNISKDPHSGEDIVHVIDTVTMQYRTFSGTNQDHIQYFSDEFRDLLAFEIELSYADASGFVHKCLFLSKEDIKHPDARIVEKKQEGRYQGVKVDIPESFRVDRLRCRICFEYNTLARRLFTWHMTVPTKGACFIVVSDIAGLDLEIVPFGIREDAFTREKLGSTDIINVPGWLLPETGFAFIIRKWS